jgi:hypothetical protein
MRIRTETTKLVFIENQTAPGGALISGRPEMCPACGRPLIGAAEELKLLPEAFAADERRESSPKGVVDLKKQEE